MGTWLDTETKAILQGLPPEKLAPPNTATFAVVLLDIQQANLKRLALTISRFRNPHEAFSILAHPLPMIIQQGLSYEDALLDQFECITCDAISVFVADEVVKNAPQNYLAALYADVRHSPEFDLIPIRIEFIPNDAKGREFFNRFLGIDAPKLPIELSAMKKKARIMKHWAEKIGGSILINLK